MIIRVLNCSGSESEDARPCSFLVGSSVLLEMGSAASGLSIEEQSRITDVLLSHAHLDHSKDLAFLAENVFPSRREPVCVHATADTLGKLRAHLFNNSIWPDFTALPSAGGGAVLDLLPFKAGTEWALGDLRVFSVEVVHPGGCVALFLSSSTGTVVYSGDTGPTENLWIEVKKRKNDLRAVFLETSFPNRLAELAKRSGHLTPETMKAEIAKIPEVDVPIYIYHIKAPYRDETEAELRAVSDSRVRLTEPGLTLRF